MRAPLRAGIAIFNAGRYHAAHDAWEDYWLDLETGTDDERFLHGLIQFTAAVYHATNGNWSGTTGLAESATGYLEGLPGDYRGVSLATVRDYLGELATDPEVIERRQPPALSYEGARVTVADLDLETTGIVAEIIAEEDGWDGATVDDACTFAQADVADGKAESPFVTLLFDFVSEPDERGVIMQRLSEHVDRRRTRASDVEGLFD